MAVTDPTLTLSMKTVMEHLRRKDAGDGTLATMTAQDAIDIATYFFNRYKGDVGLGDVTNPTNDQLAICIFKKLRSLFIDAKLTEVSQTQTATYVSDLEAANDAARLELEEEIGIDDNLV